MQVVMRKALFLPVGHQESIHPLRQSDALNGAVFVETINNLRDHHPYCNVRGCRRGQEPAR